MTVMTRMTVYNSKYSTLIFYFIFEMPVNRTPVLFEAYYLNDSDIEIVSDDEETHEIDDSDSSDDYEYDKDDISRKNYNRYVERRINDLSNENIDLVFKNATLEKRIEELESEKERFKSLYMIANTEVQLIQRKFVALRKRFIKNRK